MTTTATTLPSDAALLHAFAHQNDQSAFELLASRHAPWLFAAAFRQLHNHHAAEDAVQVVFILLAQRAHKMNPDHKFTGWLFNTLQFTIKNLRRENQNRLKREQARAQLPIDNAPPHASSDLADSLDAAVARLPAAYRDAILLRFYQQLSFDQLASALHITEPAARKRIDRALAALRKSLANSLNETTLASLSLIGLAQASTALPATITKLALAAKAGAALPATLTLTTKGTAYLMATAKLKTAALLTTAALLVAVPTSIITYHFAANSPQPPSQAKPNEDADPIAIYRLDPGQSLKLIPDASPSQRAHLYDFVDPQHKRNGPNPPEAFILLWSSPLRPPNAGYITGTNLKLSHILEDLLHIYPQEADGPFNFPLGGDIAINAESTDDARFADLQDSLKQNDIPLTLSFHTVTQKVIVLHGQWNFTPVPQDAADPANVGSLEIFNDHADIREPSASSAGDLRAIAGQIGKLINRPVIIEASNAPQNIHWYWKKSNVTPPIDSNELLKHISDQTGLTWSEESRPIRRLLIGSTGIPQNKPLAAIPDPATPLTLPTEVAAAFSVPPGHALRYIPDASSDQRSALYAILNPARDLTRDGNPPESFALEFSSPTTLSAYGMRTGAPVDLTSILEKFLHLDPSEVDGLTNIKIPGDFSALADTPDDARLADLQSILKNDLQQSYTLEFIYSAPQKVFLLQGTWKHIDGTLQLTDQPTRAKTNADTHQFALFLSRVFQEPVLIEAKNVPNRLSWTPLPLPSNADTALSHKKGPPNTGPAPDPATVLNRITDQTALTWSETTRPLRRLQITPAK